MVAPGGRGQAKTGGRRGPASHRLRLDRGWQFGGKVDPAAPTLPASDAVFTSITLPHTVAALSWQNWEPANWAGIWLYRRNFEFSAEFTGRRVFVQFDGAMTGATPTINGHVLPTHLGGYLPFRYEITPWLNEANNRLEVAVDGRWSNVPPDGAPEGPPSIDFMEPAGLIRSVHLEAVPAIFISDVFAKPVNVLEPARRIDIACSIDVGTVSDGPFQIRVELRDGQRVVARTQQDLRLSKTGETHVALSLSNLSDIELWDVDTPRLYDVVTTLTVGDTPVHEHRTRIGLRDARFETNGFFLNGRRLQLFGLNRHELYPYVGFSMPERVMRRDAQILRRDLNCNVVRCSHYPQSDVFLDACDELGLLVWEEIPGWHYIGDDVWQEFAVRDVQDMVRRDRNRPSIIIWGVRVNESKNNPPLYRRTNDVARKLDDSRAISGAMDGSLYQLKDWAEDVFAYNDYYHPGPTGLAQLRPPLPGFPYLVTEAVGQIVGPGPGSGHKYRRAGDPAVQMRQAIYHAQVHDQAARDPRYTGVIAWCGFDYGSLMNSYSGVKCPGVCDIFRLPKLGAAFYLAHVSPAVRPVIQPNFFWDFGPQTPRGPGAHAAIFSNCRRLEVFLAGRRLAVLQPDSAGFPHLEYPPFFVDLDLDGSELPDLRIDGFVNDRLVLSQSYSANPAHDRFELAADDAELIADGSDATRIVFRVVDRFGVNRAFADGTVSFELTGPGVLVGDSPFSLAETGGAGAVWLKTLPGQTGKIEIRASHSKHGAQSLTVGVRPDLAAANDDHIGT
jgi:beta-galactosidase